MYRVVAWPCKCRCTAAVVRWDVPGVPQARIVSHAVQGSRCAGQQPIHLITIMKALQCKVVLHAPGDTLYVYSL